jgi:predicted hydrocarbon binding protein
VLLSGLVDGTARHYGEQADVEETACMHRGATACLFEVRLRSPAPAA